VYRGKAAQTLKNDLNEMGVKIKFLNNDLEMGIEQLKEYCDIIRKDIDQVKENIIQTIQRYHDEFIKKINMYEDASVESLIKESESKVNTYKLINETKYFIERWGNYLKKPFIDDVQLTSASSQAKKFIVDLEKEIAQSQRNYLNENLLKFYRNLNSVNPIAIKLNQTLEDFLSITF
jgi:chemotaxis regulatin CheY-phosphate phosphatase CheZ